MGHKLNDSIKNIQVARGEIFNVVDAVLRDVAYGAKADIESEWPVAKEDGGTSLAGFETERESNDVDKVTWSVVNDVDYVPYVHDEPKYGGPPGLIFRLVADIEENKTVEDYISDGIASLLV